METMLFIDGKNAAYRALFAARGNPDFRRTNVHPFVVWLRFVNGWITEFKPDSVHVFWDCPKRDVWRRKLLVEYKEQREKMAHHTDEVKEELGRLVAAATAILPQLGVRQYLRPNQECDDLIYAACKVTIPPKSIQRQAIIISSDSDFLQLPWVMPHTKVFRPKDGKIADDPVCDPAVLKALTGDVADNIDGYCGIGPVKGAKLASDPIKLMEFFGLVDIRKFHRNLSLIDLSLNPATGSNCIFVLRNMSRPVQYDKAAVFELAIKHKVQGLMGEYPNLALSFMSLIPR